MGGDITQFYLFLGLMILLAAYLTYRSKAAYPFELFIVVYYLLTGNINELATFKIPGISFFEIQPDRLLLLVFAFLLFRRLWWPPERKKDDMPMNLPWFKLMLNLFVLATVVSLFTHAGELGLKYVIVEALKPVNLLLIIYGLSVITSRETLHTIGKAIIIAAVVTSLISVIQLLVAPDFLRFGEYRPAFGDFLRSNGIYKTERTNGFFLLCAMSWVLIMLKDSKLIKYLLVGLFVVGVMCTFHRMSWLLTFLALMIYFIVIEKMSLDRVLAVGLAGLALILSVAILFMEDIKESTLVRERLTDTVGGRKGYYKLALESLGDKPLFGYGGKNNETYYYGMMRIMRTRERATGEEGGFHSGYFSTMFYYGLPAFIFYTAFVILSIIYFARLSRHHLFFLIPFLLAVLYAVGNLTNTNLFFTGGILFSMHIGMGLGARRTKSFFLPPPLKK